MKDVQARPIPGYPYYFASRGGNIFRYRDGALHPVKARRVMGKSFNKQPRTNYLIDLSVNGTTFKNLSVGALVLWAFEGPPHSHEGTQYLDGDAVNTRITNLQWRIYKGVVGQKFETWRRKRLEKLQKARGESGCWDPRTEYRDFDVTLPVQGDFEDDREPQSSEVPG